ncbi:MAG: hypothetical protein JO058_04750, partial [Alphaproteobacteria bacterium]|nr:hypothetical protein [Alphaproteobacteria bacterium]
MSNIRSAFAVIRRRIRALQQDRRGGVLMICGFAIIPLVFATGMGVDYARAERLQTKLNAAADAAALTAVSQSNMQLTAAQATTAAQNMFIAQASGLKGLVLNTADTTQFKVTVSDTVGAVKVRTATVTYKGQSTNAFGGILGIASLTVSGTTASTAS